MKKIKKVLPLLLLPLSVFASDDLGDLESLLNEATEIATKSKLNIDYVPGNVVVIKGEELKRLGSVNLFHTYFDQVAGIEHPIRSLRGTGGVYGSMKVKFLLNGVELDNQLFGTIWFPSIAAEQIERVEIIKGPGSSIYGGYAVNGVINIITKEDVKNVTVSGSYLRDGHFRKMVSLGDTEKIGDYKLNMMLNYFDDDGYEPYVKEDLLYSMGLGAYSNAPEEIETGQENGSLLMILQNEKNKLQMDYQFANRDEDYGEGIAGILPPNDGKPNQLYDIVRFDFERTEDLQQLGELKLNAGYQLMLDHEKDLTFYPVIPDVVPYGLKMDGRFQTTEYYIGSEWQKRYAGHTLLLGGKYKTVDSENADFESNMDPETGESYPYMVSYSGDKNFIREGVQRNIASFYLQDQWNLNDKMTLTFGARYDNYDDIGEAISPRVAAVYRLNESNILKAQYARAFRAPTFFEIYTQNGTFWENPDLKPEIADTYEVEHIYRMSDFHWTNTLLYTKFSDVIATYDSNINDNIASAKVYGWESEVQWKRDKHEVKANFSLYDTYDEQLKRKFSNTSHFMTNFIYTYYATYKTPITIWHKYRSGRERADGDSRDEFPAKQFVNLSIQHKFRDVEVALFVEDLFDEGLEVPSAANTFEDDYYIRGRVIGSSLTYSW